jgi:hypothetical protein
MVIVGCTPGTCFQETTEPSASPTTASKQAFVALSNRTAKAWRAGGLDPWTLAFSGSRSETETNRVVVETFPAAFKIATADETSEADNGSSGWRAAKGPDGEITTSDDIEPPVSRKD